MFDFPPATLVNRLVPKAKFHNNVKLNTRLNTRLKKLLTDQVQEIRWMAKLSQETINLPPTPAVTEIALFKILVKTTELSTDVLELIDKAIPYPIIFEIQQAKADLHRYAAAYKRPSEADTQKWVIGSHAITDWKPIPERPESPDPATLPTAIDLEHLYAALLDKILPIPPRMGEALPQYIARCDSWLLNQSKIAQLTSRIRREKQFNRRVELNSQLNKLKRQVAKLI